tara:strand:+ start:168 stop:854 length:687 start_codon:yes stop_codon:yes gene_type:complete
MKNLKILGTSHIAKQSIKEIKQAISSFEPEIVAVELDKQRAHSLLKEEKNKISISSILQIGLKGYLFAKIGQIVQQKLGKTVGVSPGADMKTALLVAKEHKLKVALVDQPIQITLKNFSKELSWKERGRFVVDIFKGIFFRKKQMKLLGLDKFDLDKVPTGKVIEQMMKHLKDRYPNIYKTLVHDRNKYMVRQLVKLMRKFPDKKILCVVGAGHKEGMEELLLKVDVV